MVAEEVAIEALPPAERSMDDILAGVIRFTLGGQPFAMAVLPMGAHDRWQEEMDRTQQGAFDSISETGKGLAIVKSLNVAFASIQDQLLDALIAYDRDKVLPPRDEIREIATRQDIIYAIREVRAVGGDPLAVGALSALSAPRRPRSPGLTRDFERSNGSPKSTGGRRRSSKKH